MELLSNYDGEQNAVCCITGICLLPSGLPGRPRRERTERRQGEQRLTAAAVLACRVHWTHLAVLPQQGAMGFPGMLGQKVSAENSHNFRCGDDLFQKCAASEAPTVK